MVTFKTHNSDHETETDRMEGKQKKQWSKILNKKMLSNDTKKIIYIHTRKKNQVNLDNPLTLRLWV
jgi:hypothetical protein